MKIKVLFFGIVRDITGSGLKEYEVNSAIRIHEFQKILQNDFPKLKDLKKYAFAVNDTYAKADYQLKENDIVAVIPPVSGG